MKELKKNREDHFAKILIVQGGPGKEDKEENISLLIRLMDEGFKKDHYDYVCFSELATTLYFPAIMDKRFFAYAEPIPGPATEVFSKKAKEYSCNICLPLFEKGKVKGEFYNSAVIIDRKGNLVKGRLQDGREVNCYRKVQIPLADKWANEKYYFRQGPGYVTFDTDLARIGTLICHDRSYPEAWRTLALMGAEIVFVGVNSWPPRRRAPFLTEISTMAVQNGLFVVVSSKGGPETVESELLFIGHSAIIRPIGGEILVEGPVDKGWELVSGTIDLQDLERYHETYHYFRDRRPELYKLITENNF